MINQNFQNIAVKLILAIAIIVTLSISLSCGKSRAADDSVSITLSPESRTLFSKPYGICKMNALVIGIGSYLSAHYNTRYAVNDAEQFANVLGTNYKLNNLKLLIDSAATKLDIKNAICNWLNEFANENTTSIIFFAGRGESDSLTTFDTLSNSHVNDISAEEIKDWIGLLKSKNIVILLDCCSSAEFGERIVNEKTSIIASCGQNELSWQTEKYCHGVFSYYLIEALSHFQLTDLNKDSQITINELYEKVEKGMKAEFEIFPPPSAQNPTLINENQIDWVLLW